MARDEKSGGGRGLTGGLETAVGIGLGALVGHWIDLRHNTDPWGLVIGAAIGFAGGMYLLVKELIRSNRNKD